MSNEATEAQKARLADLRAQRAQIEAERTAREQERSIEQQIADEAIALDDERAIAKAEADHGQVGKAIGVVKTSLGVVILKRSLAVKFRRFQEQEIDAAAIEKFVRPCLVYPDLAKFEALVDELPAVWGMCANELSVLAGLKRKELTGKS